MVTDASKTDNLIEQVVVADLYCWTTLRPTSMGVPGSRDHHRAFRGDLIAVTKDERDRGQRLGAIADPADEAEARAAVDELAEPWPAGEEGDTAIGAMDAAEVAAYVGQHPGEANRVFSLEKARKSARKTVLRSLGVDPDAPLPDELPILDLTDVGGSADAAVAGADGLGGPAAVG